MLIFIIKELGSSGDEATTMIIAEHREDFEYLHQKAEISTQTDRKTEADISTQTGGDDDDDATTNIEGPVEEVVVMETAATEEDPPNESAVVIAEEASEETANEELLDNQTAGIVIGEVVNVFENMVFRAEWVEVTDNCEINHIKNYDPEEENMNGCEENESEIAAEPESNPNKSIIEDNIVAEDNNIEETVPLEISSSLPKVVADCVEAVFAAASESADFAAVNTSEPSVDEVITEDNGEGAGDMSAGEVLIETAEPESNTVIPEAGETNSVPSLDEEPVSTVMETISEVVCEEPNPTPGNQEMPVEELSVPLVTEILVKVEEKLSTVTEDEPSERCDGCPEEEFIMLETPSNQLTIIDELPEDTLNSPDDEVKPESIPEVITTDDNAEVSEDVIADMEPETAEEAEPSPVIVKDDAEVILEAAIDVLSQEFELSAITQDSAVCDDIPLEEEVIAATTFVPLSRERGASLTIPEEPSETVAEEMNEEATEALTNELEAVPESVEEDTTVQDSFAEEEVTRVAASEEPVDENPSPCEEDATTEALENILESVVEANSEKSEPCISVQEEFVNENVAPVEVLLEDADKETAAPSEVAVEEPTNSNPVISEEPAEESANLLEEQQTKPEVLVVILETTEDEGTEEMIHETDVSAVEENSEDSRIATSDEPVAEGVEAVLEAIVEEIITRSQGVATECNLVTSEEVAPEIIAESETEEKAENNLSVNSTDSTQSAEIIEDTPVTGTDMEALLVRLQSACTSIVVESAYRLCGLKMSSLGYSITVTIHVAPMEEQQ